MHQRAAQQQAQPGSRRNPGHERVPGSSRARATRLSSAVKSLFASPLCIFGLCRLAIGCPSRERFPDPVQFSSPHQNKRPQGPFHSPLPGSTRLLSAAKGDAGGSSSMGKLRIRLFLSRSASAQAVYYRDGDVLGHKCIGKFTGRAMFSSLHAKPSKCRFL
jgi:hypothetical protein